MGLVLSRFAISKLTGWEISVQAFIEMAKPLGLNPTFFRVSTGVLILVVFLSYLTTAFLTLGTFQPAISYRKIALFTNALGLLTMAGALLSEFFLRVQPKMPLVYIAVGIILFSAINLWIINKKTHYDQPI